MLQALITRDLVTVISVFRATGVTLEAIGVGSRNGLVLALLTISKGYPLPRALMIEA
ncbi:hypothetical protein EDF58_1011480 [Novosphingobium sp. PhB57]|nr:hypothetical protein EDF58_1011480 [Novosphingobium sp. PhB57]